MNTSSKITLASVLSFLMTEELSLDDHRKIVAAVNSCHKRRQAAAKRSLAVGDKVTWASKFGYPMTGTITEIRRTRAAVTANGGDRWSVSLTLLKPAAG